MQQSDATGTEYQPYKYTGKEYDLKHGLNLYDYGARFYDPGLGRFMTIDPLAEKYYSVSPYAYCYNNPLKYIDPDGKDGVFVVYPDYKISTPLGKVSNLGHAGVLLIDNQTGNTKYYEYGRYDKEGKGEARTISVSDVIIGKNGKPTEKSLQIVLGQLSQKAGQKGKIEAAYVTSGKFSEMKKYAESKMDENNNSNRERYSLTDNNCGSFVIDVLNQDVDVEKKSPVIISSRPNSMIEEYQNVFKSILYNPNKK